MKSTTSPSLAAMLMQSGPDACRASRAAPPVLARRRPGRGGGGAGKRLVDDGAALGRGNRAGAAQGRAQRKTVQHQEGGIVRQVLVRDGQKVRAGEPLIVVGDVRNDSTLKLLQDQLAAEQIREARAAAEAALAPHFSAPADSREHALFVTRRRILDEQIASLQTQIREAEAQASALQAQIEATETSARLSAEELEMNDRLARQGFVNRTRLLALQRTEADYRARVGEYRSELAAARQRIADMRARIAQARNLYQSQAADELRDASAKVRDLEERVRPSQDQVERQIVRSPVDGEVMAMRVSAIGAVIGPREPILDVVPGQEKLVVEARIRPQDIDHVRKDARGAPGERLDSRTAPLLRQGGVRLGRPREGRRQPGVVVRRHRRARPGGDHPLPRTAAACRHAGRTVCHHPGAHFGRVPRKAPGGLCESRHARAVMTHTSQDPFNHRKA